MLTNSDKLTDDDFLNDFNNGVGLEDKPPTNEDKDTSGPENEKDESELVEEDNTEESLEEEENNEEEKKEDKEDKNTDDSSGSESNDDVLDDSDILEDKEEKDSKIIKEDSDKVSKPNAEGEKEKKAPDENTESKTKEIDKDLNKYKSFHDEILKPFKANGKMIHVDSAEEAIKLMQMGANYTRKMQALQPARKILAMLENNGLMDESKISYLIDLDKKNPQAIQKLVKDSGVDPLEIDVENDTNYTPGNHSVSDQEIVFQSVLDDIASTSDGKETIRVISNTWDQASKDILWTNPEVMSLIHQQREAGIYDRVSTEVERQRMLGTIPQGVPFLEAYKQVGNAMTQSGQFDDLNNNQNPEANKRVIATKAARPNKSVSNGSNKKVKALSPTRSNTKSKAVVDFSNLDDDAFLKSMENRV